MAGLLGRTLTSRVPTFVFGRRAAAGIHTYTGAVSKNMIKIKTGAYDDYLAAVNEVVPEVLALPGFFNKGICTMGGEVCLPKPCTVFGTNFWESAQAAEDAASSMGSIVSKLSHCIETSDPMSSREIFEADFVDYGGFQATEVTMMPAVLSMAVLPVKPGARAFFKELFTKDETMKAMEKVNIPIGFQALMYVNDTTVLSVTAFKDLAAYGEFQSEAVQGQVGELYKDWGMLDYLTGKFAGRTLIPHGFVGATGK